MRENTSQIYLASKSPQRVALLSQMGLVFSQLQVSVPEILAENESCDAYICRLAKQKSQAGMASIADENIVVIGADTVILYKNKILEKPLDEQNGNEMLVMLSNNKHSVKTAVSICSRKRCETFVQTSHVTMGSISDREIKEYWLTGEPCNKAGAYAIQGKGALFIEHIEGSYSGIMGLPIYETARLLNSFGIKCF